MPTLLRFSAPRVVEVIDVPAPALLPGQVRVRTLYSGISAGTELTAYRGTNPYLTRQWDPDIRLFRDGAPESPGYPLDGWGYSEVGEIIETAPDVGAAVSVGDTVWGIWGHRGEAVLPVEAVAGHQLPTGLDPLAAAFVRVGAVALNGVLAADLGVGSTVAIFGQGVIGLLATRFAVLNGATVIAIDAIEGRRNRALAWGAAHALEPGADVALRIRELTGGQGTDTAIELSGNYAALRDAVRTVGADGTVVAAGFYQGDAASLRLGDEFHHNRVQILASQIGSVPNRLRARWDVPRLQRTVVDTLAKGAIDTTSLVTHRYRLEDAPAAYEMLDVDPAAALQVVLDFS
ncbi:zinc-binding dehydrogenase [Kribbella sp. NPDC048928]|uniref:zinc-binding dehydrogenase n=1 Tax=Kribbella sp. NPDC048928 TaxID=3364111 RepID=UPI00371CA58D